MKISSNFSDFFHNGHIYLSSHISNPFILLQVQEVWAGGRVVYDVLGNATVSTSKDM